MPENKGQEKTEQPTDKRKKESREKGQVAKSNEISSFAVFTSGLMILLMSKSYIGHSMSKMAINIFDSFDYLELNRSIIQIYVLKGVLFFFLTTAPVFLGIIVFAFAANIGQVGLKISSKALKPKMDKFNPIKGIKKLFFSSKSFVEVLKSLLKLLLISVFAYIVLKDSVLNSTKLVDHSIPEIVAFMLDAAYSFLWKVVLVYAALAVGDFIFQKYKHKKDLMMTKQEVKEEHKQTEGDPVVKGKIKNKMIESAKRRMMKEVPEADVVITNPTHYAIALKYEPQKYNSPKVVAKGTDRVADRIKNIAVENNVPLHEDRTLARSLYKYCDIGDFIPETLFQAVAKILAYVYQAKTKKY